MRRTRKAATGADDLRSEYAFDYAKARPNRFASQMGGNVITIVLEPDVAKVFDSSESVNRLLRSVISAIPSSGQPAAARKPRRKAG